MLESQSTNEQNLDLQRDALRKAGVSAKNLYTDTITGTKAERPGLEATLSHLREGDTLVVWRLDRLGRSLKHLIETVTTLKQQHIAFQSITEHINTATATGQLVFHLFGALAEFERNLITERTMAGLQAARARGRKGGRPKLNPSVSKVAMANKLYADHTNSIADICRTLHISRATLYPTLSRCGSKKSYIPSFDGLTESMRWSQEGHRWNPSVLNAWTI